MSPPAAPPFRADHVGSLLRPEVLKKAREKFLGPQTPTNNLGERIGLRAANDGELRRRSWWLELIPGWEGFVADRTGSASLPRWQE